MKNTNRNHRKIVHLTLVAVMTALATVIYLLLPEIPLVPGVNYLKIDFSDLPALLLGFVSGPVYGIAVEVLKNLVHLTRSETVGIGEVMNIGIGSAMIGGITLFTRWLSRLMKKPQLHPLPYFLSAALTLLGCIAAGWLLNAALTPLFYRVMGMPLTTELLLAGIGGSTALNAVKCALNLLPFYPVYYAAAAAVCHLLPTETEIG